MAGWEAIHPLDQLGGQGRGETFSVVTRPKNGSKGPNGPLEKTWRSSETEYADRMERNRGWEGVL